MRLDKNGRSTAVSHRSQRNRKANVTILSGDLLGNDNSNLALDEPTCQDNSYHVVRNGVGNNIGRLDGFTITGGHANGGGIYSGNNSLILANLILIHNVAKDDGSGLRNAFADLTISNVQFISENPQFTNANGADQIAGTRDDDLSLLTTSPAIDAGQTVRFPLIRPI